MTKEQAYYIFLFLLLVVGLLLQVVFAQVGHGRSNEHYIGVNVSRIDGVCVYTWLGGWDYDSFVKDVAVDNNSVGHPEPYAVIAVNKSCNLTVSMYMEPVKSFVRIYPKV
jgi:hypothetical protein